MPVQYSSIIEEHLAVRSAVGIVDVSHMGRLRFEGRARPSFWPSCLTRRVADMQPGQVRYSLVTNDVGCILDDVLVGFYHDPYGQPFYLLVVNAGNHTKIVNWIHAHLLRERAERPGQEIVFADVSRLWAMFAIQGPRSVELLQPLVDVDLETMKYYRGAQIRILHPAAKRQGGTISRTGYTGEDGFELSVGADIAMGVWDAIMEQGRSLGVLPVGLGCRDTCGSRPECRSMATSFPSRSIPSRQALALRAIWPATISPAATPCCESKGAAEGSSHWPGNAGKRAPRPGCPILANGKKIGEVTSGSYSPTLSKAIAMGYVASEFSKSGLELQIDIRGHIEPARVVDLPFYVREKKGSKK